MILQFQVNVSFSEDPHIFPQDFRRFKDGAFQKQAVNLPVLSAGQENEVSSRVFELLFADNWRASVPRRRVSVAQEDAELSVALVVLGQDDDSEAFHFRSIKLLTANCLFAKRLNFRLNAQNRQHAGFHAGIIEPDGA